jgi:hypothetical protein
MTVDAMLARLEEISAEARSLNEQISQIQKSCSSHEWGESYYSPSITHDLYSFCTGPDGKILPDIGPERQIPRWARRCIKCKKIEYTMNTKVVAKVPDFDIKEVPNFIPFNQAEPDRSLIDTA